MGAPRGLQKLEKSCSRDRPKTHETDMSQCDSVSLIIVATFIISFSPITLTGVDSQQHGERFRKSHIVSLTHFIHFDVKIYENKSQSHPLSY